MKVVDSRSLRSFLALFALVGCAPTAAPPPASPEGAVETAPPASGTPEPVPAAEPAAPGEGSATTEPRGTPGREPAGVGGLCGGIAGFQCQKELYCSFAPEARCGAADQTGTCQPRPQACTFEYAPVCGCDDKTYSNACAAASAGVSVARKGECSAGSSSAEPPAKKIAEGQLCGTRGVEGECAEGLYCAYRNRCGEDDTGGTCTKKTEMCTKIYKPVCGCDGKTYGSACTAAGAGVSVASQGACPNSP